MRKYTFIVMMFLLSGCNAWQQRSEPVIPAQVGQVYEHQLANGMKVLVKVDRRAQVAVNQIWYRIGSSYEHNGITGISHMLEHMMFKGSKRLKPGEFSKIVAANGGRDNAFTGRDYTAYFQTVASDRLPLMLELEADRMRNIRISEAEFAKELEVVKEERLWRTEDRPHHLLHERYWATAFLNSPYHHPVIGWMEDLNHLHMSDAMAWYQQWYAPNNAVLVVVGDVEPGEVFALVEKHFGGYKSEILTPPKPQVETRQYGPRRIQVHGRTVSPYLLMGWKVPSAVTADDAWEAYALEVLAGVLDGGNSARFSRELVRQQGIAESANVYYGFTDRMTTLFTLSGVPAAGHDLQVLEKAFWRQINAVQQQPVDAGELARVKSQVVASTVYEKDAMFYQAMALGLFETVGLGWQNVDRYVEGIHAVTAEQVQRVAQKYLSATTVTVAELIPEVNAGEEQK